jgi:hypothetical protein
MIANKKEFNRGLIMMVIFVVVLIIFFSPIFNGKNGLGYLDDLYNSISKGSANYIPAMRESAQKLEGQRATLNLTFNNADQAGQASLLFEKSGADVEATDAELTVTGDLEAIMANCLEDAEAMYYNQGEKVSAKYGYEERRVLYNWWTAAKEMDKNLSKQKKFKEAKVVADIQKKAIETAYNYYEIEPQKITERLGIIIFSLLFYVVYTMWYGFAFMFMFEGWGMQLDH